MDTHEKDGVRTAAEAISLIKSHARVPQHTRGHEDVVSRGDGTDGPGGVSFPIEECSSFDPMRYWLGEVG
jgi:hypothetical protein